MRPFIKASPLMVVAILAGLFASSPRAADQTPDSDATAMERYLKLREAEDWENAAAVVREHISELESKHGERADETLHAYIMQADYQSYQDDLAEARKARDIAMTILKRATRIPELERALAFTTLATLSVEFEDYAIADDLTREAMALSVSKFQFGLPHVAERFITISEGYAEQGHLREAERAIDEARRAIDLCPDAQRVDCLDAMARVATFYWEHARQREAVELLEAAAFIAESQGEKLVGKAAMFLVLASLDHALLHDYAKAEADARRAVALAERAEGEDRGVAGQAMSILADMCISRGKWEEAETFAKKSLAIQEEAFGTDSPEACKPRKSLVDLYWDQGRYREAERLLRKSIAVLQPRVAAGEEEHFVSFVSCVELLAALLAEEERFDEADELFLVTVRLIESRYGKNSPHSYDTLRNYSSTLFERGYIEEAEKVCARAVDVLADTDYGSDRGVARTLAFLGITQLAQGKWSDASANIDKAAHKMVRHLRRNLPALSSTEQIRVLRKDYSFAATLPLMAGLLLSDEPSVREQSASWLFNSKGLAHEAMALGGNRQHGDHEADCWMDVGRVRERIPRNAMYVDFTRIEILDYKPNPRKRENNAQNARYAAWIVPPQGKHSIQVVDLGEASDIDAVIASYRDVLREVSGEKTTITSDGEAAAEKVLADAAKRLADKLLAPILAHIRASGLEAEISELIISPDGELWLVPWAAIPLDDGRYLVERYAIATVTSARDLVPDDETQPETSSPLIFADPLFDVPPEMLAEAVKATTEDNDLHDHVDERGVAVAASGLRSGGEISRMSRLPGSLDEARRVRGGIERLTKTKPKMFVQARALEERVKQARSPRILHFATHGFVLPDQPVKTERLPRTMSGIASGRAIQGLTSATGEPLEDPLLRCGLMLTGCNLPIDGRPNGVEDGCLTGKEIVGLDLRGTDLVVLSACDTGLGRVQYGEGVAGLRQAFLIAGADAVLATLWKVPDGPTADLVAGFFDYLAAGERKSFALQRAQIDLIKKRRKERGAAHPAAWAAFELTGF